MLKAVLVWGMLVGGASPGVAAELCSAKAMSGAEGEINRFMKILVENAPVTCGIMKDEQPGRCSMLCATPYAMDQSQRRAALVYLVGAAGVQINKIGPQKFGKVIYIDRDLAKEGVGMSMPAPTLADIQRRAKSDQIDARQLVTLTMENFKRVSAKAPKR